MLTLFGVRLLHCTPASFAPPHPRPQEFLGVFVIGDGSAGTGLSTHIKSCACNASTGRWRQEGSWDLLAGQGS